MWGLGKWGKNQRAKSHTDEAHEAKRRAEDTQRQVKESGVHVEHILADLRRIRKRNNLADQLRREIRGLQ